MNSIPKGFYSSLDVVATNQCKVTTETLKPMKKQIVKTFAQQGDVTLTKIDAIPTGEQKIISRKRCVLAEGEHTGHCHAVEETDAELIQIGERILLKLERSATVTHQEHNPITLSPGIWEVGRVQEFDYFAKMARPVQD